VLRSQHRRLRAGTGNGEVRHALHFRADSRTTGEQEPARLPNSSAGSQSVPPSGQPTQCLAGSSSGPRCMTSRTKDADIDPQGQRGLALPAARPSHEGDHPVLGAGGDAELRPRHQYRGTRPLQPDRRRFSGPRRFRPLADARPARYERLHPRHGLITRNDKETSRGRCHSTRNRPTRARIRSELLIPRNGRGQPGAQMATTFAPRRQGPVEVRAWVHRRSSPRPSSSQIQVKS